MNGSQKDNVSDENVAQLKSKLKRYGQEHVLTWWKDLSDNERLHLSSELDEVDLEEMENMWKKTCGEDKVSDRDMSSMEPVEAELCGSMLTATHEDINQYTEVTLRAVAAGQVGVLLLAGGQGTRLGVGYPKGMYDIGLPSGKTLYQVQLERIRRLEELARRLTGEEGKIQMFIMTSEATKVATHQFLEKHQYFGLSKEQVTIFEQRVIPAFDNQGKFIMETKSKIARSPDGNGGLYWALKNKGVIQSMETNDVKFLHVYCVDNVLVKVADPVFMGFCISKNVESGNKVVEKGWPEEAVGVVCKLEGKIQVVEYSEISKETSELRTADGKLTYKAGNICNHFFTREFLKRVCENHLMELPHHIAKKKIPFTDLSTGIAHKPEKPNGVKLEKFVFDVFQFADSFVIWECVREDEFSPLKNAETAQKDTPSTARQSLFALHKRFLEHAGATLETNNNENETVIEISPLRSYAGEGLDEFKDKTLKTPFTLNEEHSNGH